MAFQCMVRKHRTELFKQMLQAALYFSSIECQEYHANAGLEIIQ